MHKQEIERETDSQRIINSLLLLELRVKWETGRDKFLKDLIGV